MRARSLLWQIYHCEGVICPITCAMHVAAAFEKPCVGIAGGREEPWWEHYGYGNNFGPKAKPIAVPHRYLHTVGQLSCCEKKGCWKKKVTRHENDKSVCHKPAQRPLGAQPLPLCMEMITVDHVVDAILSYYEDGTLEPPAPALSKPSVVRLPRLSHV